MERGGHVYILTNKNHTTFYVGVTSDLQNRIKEHQDKIYPKSYTARYNLHKLVYYNFFSSIEEAISKEKYIKGKNRAFKLDLKTSKIQTGMISLNLTSKTSDFKNSSFRAAAKNLKPSRGKLILEVAHRFTTLGAYLLLSDGLLKKQL